jgi:hypothetical protein
VLDVEGKFRICLETLPFYRDASGLKVLGKDWEWVIVWIGLDEALVLSIDL